MKTIDTNVLVRILNDDGSAQVIVAGNLLMVTEGVVIPAIVFCEAAWVLRSRYGRTRTGIAESFQALLETPNIICEFNTIRIGIEALLRGTDFADAVIAWEGKRMGADEFLSFDRRAVRRLASVNMRTRLLA